MSDPVVNSRLDIPWGRKWVWSGGADSSRGEKWCDLRSPGEGRHSQPYQVWVDVIGSYWKFPYESLIANSIYRRVSMARSLAWFRQKANRDEVSHLDLTVETPAEQGPVGCHDILIKVITLNFRGTSWCFTRKAWGLDVVAQLGACTKGSRFRGFPQRDGLDQGNEAMKLMRLLPPTKSIICWKHFPSDRFNHLVRLLCCSLLIFFRVLGGL